MAEYDDSKVRKGQAYNLAILTAIADHRQHDNEFIIKQFLRHLEFASILQKANIDQLNSLITNPETLKILKDLDGIVK
jgi:hypothetical protein